MVTLQTHGQKGSSQTPVPVYFTHRVTLSQYLSPLDGGR